MTSKPLSGPAAIAALPRNRLIGEFSLWSADLANMERGPGRHGISNAFFLYVRDPDGHRLELYTSDYFTGDHDHEPLRWSLRDPRRQTLWGAPAPRSWFEQGSPFSGQAVREPKFVADVLVAD